MAVDDDDLVVGVIDLQRVIGQLSGVFGQLAGVPGDLELEDADVFGELVEERADTPADAIQVLLPLEQDFRFDVGGRADLLVELVDVPLECREFCVCTCGATGLAVERLQVGVVLLVELVLDLEVVLAHLVDLLLQALQGGRGRLVVHCFGLGPDQGDRCGHGSVCGVGGHDVPSNKVSSVGTVPDV